MHLPLCHPFVPCSLSRLQQVKQGQPLVELIYPYVVYQTTTHAAHYFIMFQPDTKLAKIFTAVPLMFQGDDNLGEGKVIRGVIVLFFPSCSSRELEF